MSAFDTVRDLRLPGLVLGHVYIDPKKLGVRMKNMTKAMLRSGVLTGGWSSQSRQLAAKLAEGTDIRMVCSRNHGFLTPARHTYTEEIAEQVCELISADEALELLDDRQRYGHDLNRLEHRSQHTRERHEDSRNTVRTYASNRWCWMYSKDLTLQVAQVFASSRTPAQIEAAEKLCDQLDSGELLPIKLSF